MQVSSCSSISLGASGPLCDIPTQQTSINSVNSWSMDWKIFGTAFLTLFLAELGDKTQLAVITMTAKTDSKLSIFLGASLALVLVTLIGVLVGGVLAEYIPTEWLQRIVASAFIIIGVLMLFGKL